MKPVERLESAIRAAMNLIDVLGVLDPDGTIRPGREHAARDILDVLNAAKHDYFRAGETGTEVREMRPEEGSRGCARR